MRPWASARCKSQPSRFRVIHCDVWPTRAFQLFVSFRDRSPVTIKPASHPGQPYAVKPRPHAAPQFNVLSRYVALPNSVFRNRPPVTIKPALNSFCRCMSREGDPMRFTAGSRASTSNCASQRDAIRSVVLPFSAIVLGSRVKPCPMFTSPSWSR